MDDALPDRQRSDAATRARALDPGHSFIVQAPAGSGKTELLTQRYLRLLASVEHPEQVLAITFTRKAAAEMRGRILSAMQAAAGPAPQEPHKRATWDLARAVREVDARRDWRLLEHAARLRVQTIDALNAMLARRLPVLAGTGAALEPTDDPKPLYEAACEQLMERLGDGSAEASKLESLIVHLGHRVDRLISLLIDLLAKRDQWLHPVISARGSEGLRPVLEDALNAVIERHLGVLCSKLGTEYRDELWQLTRYAAENLLQEPSLNGTRRALLEACVSFGDVPGAQGRALQAWQAIASTLFKPDGDLYRQITKVQGFPTTHPAVKARMERVLADLAEDEGRCELLGALRHLPRPVYADDQWEILEALLIVLPLAVAELQLVFQSQGRADYIEGALRALQALGPPDEPTDLALVFDYRLRHILVDEFQDTSFAQLDLLERLTAGWSEGDGRTLFCVGDPMQSIYRFRQAEVGLFIELKKRGLRNLRLEPLTLSANFRSTSSIVGWVNNVFPAVLARTDDAEQGAVRYSPSFAANKSTAGGVHVHPLIEGDASAEAAHVVAIVLDALLQDEESRVAVLVTARSHIGRIASELAQAGIEVHAVDIERLAERPVVQDLIALTRALVHLADRTAWLAVLRAPWCGLTLQDLHALAAGDASATINEMLAMSLQPRADVALSDDGRTRLLRVHAVLRTALAHRARQSLRDWIEATWNALGGPATLTRAQDLDDAQAYFDRLEEIETAGDLLDVARLEEQLESLFAQPQVRGKARVDVMTIHKAKGLEFDVVILPALQRWMKGEDRELMRWTRLAGLPEGIVFAPVKAQGADADPIYRWIELLEKERTERERGRLLYVAATRAKRDLHLIGTVDLKETMDGAAVQPPRSGSMLSMLWHEVSAMFESAAVEAAGKPSYATEVAPLKLRRLPLGWTLPEADAAVRSREVSIVDLSTDQPEFDWVTETSRHVGTLVHRELDRMTRANLANTSTATSPPPSRARLLAELAELGVPPDRCDAAADRVGEAISQTLADERGRWLLGSGGQIRDTESELALSGVVHGQLVEGVIDRTFVDAQGTRWIVDFKTSTHEGGGLERFLSEQVERYRPQLTRYARLLKMFKPGEKLRAALYFPLLKAWKEVKLEEEAGRFKTLDLFG
jgi:ATP-dependent exoDNAse (exonuclease V) beta subunit